MGIDTIGGAGHECDIVLVGVYCKLIHFMGEDDVDFLDLIGKHFIENGDGKAVADNELIEIGEESCGGKSTMCGEHAVGIRTADGEG